MRTSTYTPHPFRPAGILAVFALLTFGGASAVFFASCAKRQGTPNASEAKLSVTVSIPPQKWFVMQIAGEETDVAVNVLAGEGQNPHSYEPSARQMQALAKSAFWILSGTEFEIALLPKIESQFPSLKIIDGTEGVAFRTMEETEHDDGLGHIHSANIDRHSWLGEKPAVILAEHIRDGLCAADPAHAERYRHNTNTLVSVISAEFAALREKLKPLEGTSVFVFHPSFGYFLDEFGITQEAIETGGKEPAPKMLAEIIKKAGREKPTAIFVQAQFPVSAAETLARSIGAEVVLLDPLAEKWLDNIKTMGDALAKLADATNNAEAIDAPDQRK